MIVHRVVMPVTEVVSWTVLGDDGEPVGSVESYLAHLAALERSPETVRAYAFGLKAYVEFLAANGVAWDEASVEDVGRFVAWLRAPASNVVVLDVGTARRSPATVNRYLAAVFGFYDFHARHGVGVGTQLVAWRRTNRGGYKPFLHHIGKARAVPTRPIGLVVPARTPRTLRPEQVAAILAACSHLRDRLLIGLLAETGMRVGQALGLRHSDFVTRELQLRIVPRVDNVNGARTKTRAIATIPISVPLARLYSAYMHDEYGDLDSDYVFVNLWAQPHGRPLHYQAVHKLVGRLRQRSEVDFTLHMLRHTHATALIRAGVPIEVVARLLTHRSSTTTSSTYVHLDAADIRDALRHAGMFPPTEEAT
jgi:integrase/recombinase XerD